MKAPQSKPRSKLQTTPRSEPVSKPPSNLRPIEPFRADPGTPGGVSTRADTDGELDWHKVTRLAWRPAWSIRSRRGSLSPFLDLFRRGR